MYGVGLDGKNLRPIRIISRGKATDYLPPADRWEALPEEKNDNDNE